MRNGRLYILLHCTPLYRKEWLYNAWNQFGNGDEYQLSKGVKLGDHPGGVLTQHLKDKKHKDSLKKKAKCFLILKKSIQCIQIHVGMAKSWWGARNYMIN